MITDYRLMAQQLSALTEGVDDGISNLANISALIYSGMDRLNWAGFYLLRGDTLHLGPFQGKTACVYIPVTKGVCGAAVSRNETVLVKDVHEFPGHIACDSASNSEIVIPLHRNGAVFGVLDIDSPEKARFDEADRAGLEALVREIEKRITSWQHI